MVGGDEEMSVTVVRWTVGEERLKKDIEEKKEGACAAAEPEGKPQGEEEGKKKPERKVPDIVALMLERVIDTVLLEEVTLLGAKMNRYRNVLAEGIWTFAAEHQEDKADVTRLIEAFRQGWKVYRVDEHVKDTLDTFMEAMHNQLWQPESA